MAKIRLISSLGMGAILLFAFLAQIFGVAKQRTSMIAPNIGDFIPRQIPGWTVLDRPIAETPEMKKMVDDLLNYDGAVFRVYRQGNTEIGVYLAYWLPGKVHPSVIDAHTPDVCWTLAGWTMKAFDALPSVGTGDGRVPIPNYRHFSTSTQKLSVIYWHIYGSKIRANHAVVEPRLTAWERIKRRIYQVQNTVLTRPEPQLFIRISSSGEIAAQLDMLPVKAGVELVAKLIAEKSDHR